MQQARRAIVFRKLACGEERSCVWRRLGPTAPWQAAA